MDDSSSKSNLDKIRPKHIARRFSDHLRNLRVYLRVTRAKSILRRYFVMNAFDGAMTSLGIVIGAYITHITDPRAVIGIIIVSGMAMAVSGFTGTYMTESAERGRALNELEDAMLITLEDSVHGQASRIVPVVAAFVDGSAPFLASLPSILPFALVIVGLIPVWIAFLTSIGSCLITLFILGAFLGRISEENIIYSGAKMIAAGVVVALLALLLNGGL